MKKIILHCFTLSFFCFITILFYSSKTYGNHTFSSLNEKHNKIKQNQVDTNKAIKQIRKWYYAIKEIEKQGNLTKKYYPEYQVYFKRDGYEFFLNSQNEIVMIVNSGSEFDVFRSELYIKNGNLYFIYETREADVSKENDTFEKVENRIYFHENKIIRFLNKDKKDLPATEKTTRKYLHLYKQAMSLYEDAVSELKTSSSLPEDENE